MQPGALSATAMAVPGRGRSANQRPVARFNSSYVVQAGLDFRPEADTDGIVRCTVDYQSQNPGNHIFSHQGSIDRFPNDNYDGFH